MSSRRIFAFMAFTLAGMTIPASTVYGQQNSTVALLPAADSPTAASGATTTNNPSAPLKMPVRGGAITLKVPDFLTARQKVLDAANSVGAEITDGKTYVTNKGRKHGYVRLRLSADRLPQLVPTIRGIGILYADNLFTTEQVSNYEDLGRRVQRLRKHQERLDNLLSSSRKLRGSDILYVQERLFRAGVDEESLQQQRLDMERAARTATITITLFEPIPVAASARAKANLAQWFAAGRESALYRLNRTLARATTAAAYSLVYAPLWLPLFIASAFLLRVLWRRRLQLFLLTKSGFAMFRGLIPPRP